MRRKQVILWASFALSLSIMFAGMKEISPGVYEWNTLSNLLMFPNFIALFAVPIASLRWAVRGKKAKPSAYTILDAHNALQWSSNWEANLENEIANATVESMRREGL